MVLSRESILMCPRILPFYGFFHLFLYNSYSPLSLLDLAVNRLSTSPWELLASSGDNSL